MVLAAASLTALLAGCVAAGLTMSGVLSGPRTTASLAGSAARHGRPAVRRHPGPLAAARLAAGRPLSSPEPQQLPGLRAIRPAPAAALRVSGTSVTAIGDSVMLAASPALQRALPGISIDALVSRQFYTGAQIVASLASQGQLRPIVVIALGTNGTVTPDEISQLLTAIGPHRRLVLVNTFEARPWEAEVNAALAAAARSHAGVVLADWHDAIANETSLLWDGIHPGPAAQQIYARVLAAAVAQAQALP
jgi:hypothetical protein